MPFHGDLSSLLEHLTCFSPLSTPGESIIVTLSSNSEGHTDASNCSERGEERKMVAVAGRGVLGERNESRSPIMLHRPPRSHLVEEGCPKVCEASKGKLRNNRQGIPLNDLLLLPMNHCDELVGCGFGACDKRDLG